MQIGSSLAPVVNYRGAALRPAASRIPDDIAQARAESDEDRRRAHEIEARNGDGFASLARQGLQITMGSYTSLYKQELARSIDSDGDGAIGVDELAANLGDDMERATKLYAMLDIDGDGRLGLAEFGDSVRDPFRDPGFRRQLEKSGPLEPSLMGALHRRYAARYDAAAVLGAMARSIDTAA